MTVRRVLLVGGPRNGEWMDVPHHASSFCYPDLPTSPLVAGVEQQFVIRHEHQVFVLLSGDGNPPILVGLHSDLVRDMHRYGLLRVVVASLMSPSFSAIRSALPRLTTDELHLVGSDCFEIARDRQERVKP